MNINELIERLEKKAKHWQHVADQRGSDAALHSAAIELLEAAQALRLLNDVYEDADNLCKWVQKELEQGDGWQQYDFLQVPLDLFWFYQLQKAIAALEQSDD